MQIRITPNILFYKIHNLQEFQAFIYLIYLMTSLVFVALVFFEYLKLVLNTVLQIPFPLLFKHFFVSYFTHFAIHSPFRAFLFSEIHYIDFCKGI